ncbi:hypothetical protein A3863_24400 [Priestia endophytica]|nr:hypothetical protein A3863_24400 [Priestia endophytica]
MVVINTLLYLELNETEIPNPAVHILVILITLLLAYSSRVLIEKPIIKFTKKRESKASINNDIKQIAQ